MILVTKNVTRVDKWKIITNNSWNQDLVGNPGIILHTHSNTHTLMTEGVSVVNVVDIRRSVVSNGCQGKESNSERVTRFTEVKKYIDS